ncbi:hypothetical protein KC348_g12 [Hortaea werneckii]|nr:hypothetical protein KC348_g12 [Hortaea werneckii]
MATISNKTMSILKILTGRRHFRVKLNGRSFESLRHEERFTKDATKHFAWRLPHYKNNINLLPIVLYSGLYQECSDYFSSDELLTE